MFLKISLMFIGKRLCWNLFLIKLQAFRLAIFIKSGPQPSCFSVNFTKFLRIFYKIWESFERNGSIGKKSVNVTISRYSVQMRENTDQKNSEYGHSLRSDHPLLAKENAWNIDIIWQVEKVNYTKILEKLKTTMLTELSD